MTPTASLEDIKRIASLVLGNKTIRDDDRFLEDLNAESVDLMNIIVAVEEKYGVSIKESEIPQLRTPAELHALVSSRSNH